MHAWLFEQRKNHLVLQVFAGDGMAQLSKETSSIAMSPRKLLERVATNFIENGPERRLI